MSELPVGTIVMGLLGGLALFLYGMEKMTDALKLVAGSRMKTLLARMTTNRFKAVFTGAFITAMIQSSSVTTVLVVGFISAGLLSLSQSIGIIMGAEIGTTITAQIIAFKVTKYAMVLVTAGFAAAFLGRTPKIKQYGHMVMGLGLIFFGMSLMKEATSPLRDYAPFVDAMKGMSNPLVGVLVSALFTALIQSSSATTGVVLVLAGEGFVDLEGGIALILGANIGTCITAFLASIGKPREAVRAAVVHILFNTTGVALWLGFIPLLAALIRAVSPEAEDLIGLAKLQAETPRQIANAHTCFNVANTMIFIGFTPLIARIVERIVPDRKAAQLERVDRRYLDDLLVHTPGLALEVVRMELTRLGARVLDMVKASLQPVIAGSAEELDDLHKMDNKVDSLHEALLTYLGRLSLEPLTEHQSRRLADYIAVANYYENIGDMIETNLVAAGQARLEANLEMSQATQDLMQALHEKAQWAVRRAMEASASSDAAMAEEVLSAKVDVNRLVADAEAHLSRRLAADEPNRLAAFRLESELVEAYKRIYYFAKRIAKLVTDVHTDYHRGGLADEPEPALASD